MRNTFAIAWLVFAVPAPLLAQEMPGIDLTKPPAKDEPKPADADELPPVDLSKPAKPAAQKEEEKAEAKPVLPFSEKDVALGDKVKAVQRKGFLKRGRFEVAPLFSASVNDAFYEKFGYGLRLAYSLEDSFALALRGIAFTPYRTDNAREGKLAFTSQLVSSQLYRQVMLDGVWSPVYGKASFLNKNIIHFDLFLAAGFGAVWSSTSFTHSSASPTGLISGFSGTPHLAADVGGGVRFYPKEWLAF
jgi:outer membrane beta-barrel protein